MSRTGPALLRILVLKLDFIGDLVTVLPAIRLLRHCFPDSVLTIACSPANRILAEALGTFDSVLTFDFFGDRTEPPESRVRRFQATVTGAYDLAIDFRVDSDTRPLLQGVEARLRAGIGSVRDFPYLDIALPSIRGSSNVVPRSRTPLRVLRRHIWSVIGPTMVALRDAAVRFKARAAPPRIDLYDRSTRRMIGVDKSPAPRPDLWIGEFILLLVHLCAHRLTDADPLVSAELARIEPAPMAQRTICIAPFANTETRTWPGAAWRTLVDLLVARTDLRIALLGSAAQEAAIDAIVAGCPSGRIENLAGQRDLLQVAAALRGCALLVANNSGLAHLGAALGTKVLAIYSASHAVAEWGPRGPAVRTLSALVPCRQCSLEELRFCKHDHRCMTSIEPDLVFAEVMSLLDDIPSPTAATRADLRVSDGIRLDRPVL